MESSHKGDMELPDISLLDHPAKDELIRLLLAENAELKARIVALEARLAKDSRSIGQCRQLLGSTGMKSAACFSQRMAISCARHSPRLEPMCSARRMTAAPAMPKVKQKVSGGFRTLRGAAAFCTVRSCLDTLRKQGIDLLQALVWSFQGATPQPALGGGNYPLVNSCKLT